MIVVDVETSGVSPKENSILSIGAIEFGNKENCFYGECRLRDGAKVEDEALKINGFSMEKINNADISCEQLLINFIEWSRKIEDRTLAGHNVHFDFWFLYDHSKIFKIEWIFGIRVVDLHSAMYFYMLKNKIILPMKYNHSSMSLDFILDYLKLEKRKNIFHNALEDAKLTAEAFSKLLNI